MATTPEQIEEYFKELDWPFIRKEGNLWDTGYNGNNYRFRFFVRLTDSWLYVTWLFPVAIHDDCRNNIYDHCLRMSYTMNGAKVMLDGDNDLTLTVEYPADNIQVAEYESALRNVCWNVDRFFLELTKLATDPTAVSSLAPKPADSAAASGSGGSDTSGGGTGSSGSGTSGGGSTDVDWGTGTSGSTPPAPAA
jgi:uncharacterized membrane protein YgcG